MRCGSVRCVCKDLVGPGTPASFPDFCFIEAEEMFKKIKANRTRMNKIYKEHKLVGYWNRPAVAIERISDGKHAPGPFFQQIRGTCVTPLQASTP